MYVDGSGVPQDYVMAHMWIDLAAAKSSDDRETYVTLRDTLAALMTPEQIAQAQQLARDWKPKTGQ